MQASTQLLIIVLVVVTFAVDRVVARARPSRAIDGRPPLVLLNIAPDDLLKFYFSLSGGERAIVDHAARRQPSNLKLTNDERNRRMIEAVAEADRHLAARLASVVDAVLEKAAFLTPQARELFNMVIYCILLELTFAANFLTLILCSLLSKAPKQDKPTRVHDFEASSALASTNGIT